MLNPDQVYESASPHSHSNRGVIGAPCLSRLIDNQAYQLEVDENGKLTAREISPFEIMITLESLDFVQDEVLA